MFGENLVFGAAGLFAFSTGSVSNTDLVTRCHPGTGFAYLLFFASSGAGFGGLEELLEVSTCAVYR